MIPRWQSPTGKGVSVRSGLGGLGRVESVGSSGRRMCHDTFVCMVVARVRVASPGGVVGGFGRLGHLECVGGDG